MLTLIARIDRKRLTRVVLSVAMALVGTSAACGAEDGSLAEGRLAAWGYNEYGPVDGANRAGGDFTQVLGGQYHSLALRSDSSLSAWGFDDNNRVSGPRGAGGAFTQVAAGQYYSFALRFDGSLTAWGYDTYGQVSGPNNAGDGFTQIAGGATHSLAVHSDGSLAAWGYDSQGQVSGPNNAVGDFTQVAGGSLHTLALRSNGSIAAWGYNNHGQVSGPNGASGDFTQVAGGSSHSLALRTDGSLAAWGYNNYGQVSGPNTAGDGFVQVAGGQYHSLAVRSDGSLAAWGSDAYNEVSGPNAADGFYLWVGCGYRQSYAILARELYDDLVVRDAYSFTDMDITLQRDITVYGDATIEVPLIVENSPTMTVEGSTTIAIGGVLDLDGSWTLDTPTLTVEEYGQLNVAGVVDTRLRAQPGSTVTATGNVVLGDGSLQALTLDGQLDVDSHTVTLNKQGFTNIGNLATLGGGTLEAPNGLALGSGSYLNGNGVVDGRVAAGSGSTIDATGAMTLGDATSYAGFFSDGELNTNDNTVTLIDMNEAVLGTLTNLGDNGTPGTLAAANGAVVDFGNSILGYGTVDTPDDATLPLIVNGYVGGNSPAEPITLNGHVKGVGTFDNVVFDGTLAPGFSLGTVTIAGDATIGPNGVLAMEITADKSDKLIVAGTLTVDGEIRLDWLPVEGDPSSKFGGTYTLATFSTLGGSVPPLAADSTIGAAYVKTALSDTGGALRITLHDQGEGVGDTDFDGVVGPADLAAFGIGWSPNAGDKTWFDGDFDFDGSVGPADLAAFGLAWAPNGVVFPSDTGIGVVPEPGTLIMLLLGMAGLLLHRKRR